MGRKKKEHIEASPAANELVCFIIKQYPRLKEHCGYVEKERSILLLRSGIDKTAFGKEQNPSEVFLTEPIGGKRDVDLLEAYTDAKEKVYLLERGIEKLSGTTKEVAEALFLQRKSWDETIDNLHLSRMTVSRERNRAITLIALEADDYMRWKAEQLYII